MIVWVLVIVFHGVDGPAVTTIDNIASAQSCEQLAKVFRGVAASNYSNARPSTATCAPVRKVKL